jgi:putative oxidoreductase
MHSQALMKDVAIAGGFLALAVAGAGTWSVDARLGR